MLGTDITFMDMADEQDTLGEPQIPKLFSGATVFITGGTGFLGKLLVEKLLRTCPNLKKLYVLARSKKSKDAKTRVQEQFNDTLFDKLKKVNPNIMKKVVAVAGDVGLLGLGMKEEDRQRLIDEVQFIFHGAATVNFTEKLKLAVEINVRGTRELLALARACKYLQAMVHISTAYSFCPKMKIEEKFYKSPMPGETLIQMVDTTDEKVLDSITTGLLGDYPNTYTYTKACAENLILEQSKGIPLCVVRPSIVMSTAKDPIAGWTDNLNGPIGESVAIYVGVSHVLFMDTQKRVDLVPGDMVANACIAAAWKTATSYPGQSQDQVPTIYNYVNNPEKPVTWEKYIAIVKYESELPTSKSIYVCKKVVTSSPLLFNIYFFVLQWIPACIADGAAILLGKKPVLRKLMKRIEKMTKVTVYFRIYEWDFINSNTQQLANSISAADKRIYDMDMTKFNWEEYFFNLAVGLRIYVLNDPLDTVPSAQRRRFYLLIAHYALMILLSFLAFRILWALISLFF